MFSALPAAVSSLTSAVVAGDVGSTVKIISEVLRCKAMQWPIRQRRQLELDALGGTQPLKTGQRFSYVVPKSSDGTSCSVKYRLQVTAQVSRNPRQSCVTIIQPQCMTIMHYASSSKQWNINMCSICLTKYCKRDGFGRLTACVESPALNASMSPSTSPRCWLSRWLNVIPR